MKISCNMADDLLPLYLDNGCSGDSRSAIEEHLTECASCRAKLDRMQREITAGIQAEKPGPELASYAKKVKRQRIRAAILAGVFVVIASVALALVCLTLEDMRRQSSPHVFDIEPGTVNLTADSLETTAGEAGGYVLYTNSTRIQVEVQPGTGLEGEVMLWNAEDDSGYIQSFGVDGKTSSRCFTGLSAAHRYRVTCDGLDGAAVIIISEGRTVSFWNSLGSVLRDIAGSFKFF